MGYNHTKSTMDFLIIMLGILVGTLLSLTTKNYKNTNNKLRWPKYIEFLDSLIGITLLLLLLFHIPYCIEMIIFFISINIGFHFTNFF